MDIRINGVNMAYSNDEVVGAKVQIAININDGGDNIHLSGSISLIA